MPGMMKGSMYKKGGAVKKGAAKFQEGGPVRQPGKRRIMEGGPKGLPMMTPEQRRMARESMTPEERREEGAPLSLEEVRRMGGAMKKGGMVKKKAGGMIKGKK